MKQYSTKDVPASAKAGYWNRLCNELFNLDMDAIDAHDFEAQAIVGDIGPIQVAQITSRPIVVDRTRRHISGMGVARCSLLLQTHGQSVISHHGDEMKLRENDFVVFDNTYPHRLTVEKEMTLTAFSIPGKVLKKHIPYPQAISGQCMSGIDGISTVVSGTLRGIWEQLQKGLPSQFGAAICDNLLDFLAICYAANAKSSVTDSSMTMHHRVQIKKIIEDRLHEPGLSAETIATELRMTPRYLRMVFAAENETISSYILRRRLEKSTRQLTSPVWRGRTITEIALHSGFNSAEHFSRVFRSYYGVSPREYRQSNQNGGEAR